MSVKIIAAAHKLLGKNKLGLHHVAPLAMLPEDRAWVSLADLHKANPTANRPTIHRGLKGLVKAEMVERRQPGNNRSVAYRLTVAGRKLLAAIDKLGEVRP